jgi:hypothetical protein
MSLKLIYPPLAVRVDDEIDVVGNVVFLTHDRFLSPGAVLGAVAEKFDELDLPHFLPDLRQVVLKVFVDLKILRALFKAEEACRLFRVPGFQGGFQIIPNPEQGFIDLSGNIAPRLLLGLQALFFGSRIVTVMDLRTILRPFSACIVIGKLLAGLIFIEPESDKGPIRYPSTRTNFAFLVLQVSVASCPL